MVAWQRVNRELENVIFIQRGAYTNRKNGTAYNRASGTHYLVFVHQHGGYDVTTYLVQ